MGEIDLAMIVMSIPTFIGLFAILAKYTENTADDKIAQMMLDMINYIGQNSGKAKNEVDK